MISVVIPLYNKEASIAHTLECVLEQTYKDFEVVVVDDGSTDKSASIVEQFTDSRIHLLRQPNGGVSSARNTGIKEANGEFVAFLDADDEWDVDYLDTQNRLIQKYSDCILFATNYRVKKKDGMSKDSIFKGLNINEDGILTNYFEVAAYSDPPLWTSAICVRKDAILDIGGFPIGLRSGEDLLTWARLVIKGNIAFSKKCKASYIFDATNADADQLARIPDITDYVGMQLCALYEKNPNLIGFKDYVALWYRMRANVYIYRNYRYLGFKECLKSLRYSFNFKTMVFLLISFFPYPMVKYSYKIIYAKK